MARLSRDTIHKILIAHNEGRARSLIAAEFGVDPNTVSYHVEQFENTYGSTAAVYSLVRPVQNICEHPSLKCTICGRGQDNLHRQELSHIKRLQYQIKQLGHEPVE